MREIEYQDSSIVLSLLVTCHISILISQEHEEYGREFRWGPPQTVNLRVPARLVVERFVRAKLITRFGLHLFPPALGPEGQQVLLFPPPNSKHSYTNLIGADHQFCFVLRKQETYSRELRGR